MTTPVDPRHEGSVGAITDLGNKLISALPPAFVMLLVMNVCFLGMVLWFLNHQSDQRNATVNLLLDRCMSIALHEPAPPSH